MGKEDELSFRWTDFEELICQPRKNNSSAMGNTDLKFIIKS